MGTMLIVYRGTWLNPPPLPLCTGQWGRGTRGAEGQKGRGGEWQCLVKREQTHHVLVHNSLYWSTDTPRQRETEGRGLAH
jgi:hypothetical protein